MHILIIRQFDRHWPLGQTQSGSLCSFFDWEITPRCSNRVKSQTCTVFSSNTGGRHGLLASLFSSFKALAIFIRHEFKYICLRLTYIKPFPKDSFSRDFFWKSSEKHWYTYDTYLACNKICQSRHFSKRLLSKSGSFKWVSQLTSAHIRTLNISITVEGWWSYWK